MGETVNAKTSLSRKGTPLQHLGKSWSAGDIAMLTPASVDTVVLPEYRAPDEPTVSAVRVVPGCRPALGFRARGKLAETCESVPRDNSLLATPVWDTMPLATPGTLDAEKAKSKLLSLMDFSSESGCGRDPHTVPVLITLPVTAEATSPGGASDESEAPGVVARLFL